MCISGQTQVSVVSSEITRQWESHCVTYLQLWHIVPGWSQQAVIYLYILKHDPQLMNTAAIQDRRPESQQQNPSSLVDWFGYHDKSYWNNFIANEEIEDEEIIYLQRPGVLV